LQKRIGLRIKLKILIKNIRENVKGVENYVGQTISSVKDVNQMQFLHMNMKSMKHKKGGLDVRERTS
jgi:hypothetical protein